MFSIFSKKTLLKLVLFFAQFFCCISFVEAEAEFENIQLGNNHKQDGRIEYSYQKDGNLYAVFRSPRFIKTLVFDAVSLEVVEKPLIISGKPNKKNTDIINSKYFEFFHLSKLKDKVVIFFKGIKDKKAEKYFYQELSLEGKPIGKLKKFGEKSKKQAKKGNLWFSEKGNAGSIKIIDNYETQEILIIVQEPDKKVEKKIVPGKVKLNMYDGLTLEEKSNETFDLAVENFGSSSILSSNGIIYSIVKVETDDNKQLKELEKNGVPSFYFKILGINVAQPDRVIETVIPLDDQHMVLDASLKMLNTGELLCVGNYAAPDKKGKANSFNGVFYLKINPENGEIITKSEKNLDKKNLDFLGYTKTSATNEVGSYNVKFGIKGLEVMDDGSSFILLEEDYRKIVTTSDSKGNSSTNVFDFTKTIFAVKVLKDGTIDKFYHIPKNQVLSNLETKMSFVYFNTGKSLVFIFNDSRKNYDEKTGVLKSDRMNFVYNVSLINKWNNVIARAELTSNGKQTQEIYSDTRKVCNLTAYSIKSEDGKSLYLPIWRSLSVGDRYLGFIFPPYIIYLAIKKGLKDRYYLSKLKVL